MNTVEQQLKALGLETFTQADLDYNKHELKSILQPHPQQKVSVDGISIAYFDNHGKEVITVYDFKTGETLTATIADSNNTFIKADNMCNYFADKKISIALYDNIKLDRNNFIIPLYNSNLEQVSQQNIWFDFKENCYKKGFKDGLSTKGLFYYFGDFDNAELAVIGEGVADCLAFANFFTKRFPQKQLVIISAMSVGNIEAAITSLKSRNPLIKTIFYLIDRDQKFKQVKDKYKLIDEGVGNITFERISQLNLGHTILFPIISYDPEIMPDKQNENYKYTVKDFSDIFRSGLQLENLADCIKKYFSGRLFLNPVEELMLSKTKKLNGDNDALNPLIIDFTLTKLNLYKYCIVGEDLFVLNPNTATYSELPFKTADDIANDINHQIHIIPNFIHLCSEVAPREFLTNSVVKLKENIFERLKSPQSHLTVMENGVNLKNGSVSFERLEFKQEYIKTTKHLPWRYFSDSEYQDKFSNSIVSKFLSDILPDPDDYQQLEESIGNIFSSGRRDKMIYLLGGGSNGKSVLLNLLIEAFGKFSASIKLDDILIDPNSRLSMLNKLVVVSPEFSGNIKNLEIFKTLVSREAIPIKQLYKDIKNVSGLPVPVIATNDLPTLSSTNNSTAFIRRIAPLRFTQQFPQNISFEQKIREAGNVEIFFNWCIRCAFKMTNDKSDITLSPNNLELLGEIKNKIEPVSAFISEMDIAPGTIEVSASILYAGFKQYCEDNGFAVCNSTRFGLKLTDCKLGKKVKSGKTFYLLNQVFN